MVLFNIYSWFLYKTIFKNADFYRKCKLDFISIKKYLTELKQTWFVQSLNVPLQNFVWQSGTSKMVNYIEGVIFGVLASCAVGYGFETRFGVLASCAVDYEFKTRSGQIKDC